MTRHEQLLEQYAQDLRIAKAAAERWWATLRAHEEAIARSSKDATDALQRRWPEGPASHPRVLAVIRKYWLACESLNELIEREGNSPSPPTEADYFLADEEESEEAEEEPEEEEEIYPHIFILEWLMTDENEDLAAFLAALSYWPVGLDENDTYT